MVYSSHGLISSRVACPAFDYFSICYVHRQPTVQFSDTIQPRVGGTLKPNPSHVYFIITYSSTKDLIYYRIFDSTFWFILLMVLSVRCSRVACPAFAYISVFALSRHRQQTVQFSDTVQPWVGGTRNPALSQPRIWKTSLSSGPMAVRWCCFAYHYVFRGRGVMGSDSRQIVDAARLYVVRRRIHSVLTPWTGILFLDTLKSTDGVPTLRQPALPFDWQHFPGVGLSTLSSSRFTLCLTYYSWSRPIHSSSV